MRSPLYQLSVFKIGYAAAQVVPRTVGQRIADAFAWLTLQTQQGLLPMMRDNLHTVTGLNGAALDRLIRANVRTFCRMLADYFLCAGDRAANARQLVTEWQGLEHIEAAQRRGKGTILVTGHLGHWELGGLLLALSGIRMTVVTLPEPTSELMQWREACRRRLGIQTIAVGPGHEFAFVEMLRVLRDGGCLAMLVDRPYSGNGMPVRQFGRQTQFSTAAATLAHHTGASILPAFVLRDNADDPRAGYRAFACAPIEQEAGPLRETLGRNVQRIADLFEHHIRQHPEQWFNYVPVFESAAPSLP